MSFCPLDLDSAQALAEAPGWTLVDLEISENHGMSAACIEVLGQAAFVPSLHELSLDANSLEDDALIALSRWPANTNIRRLGLLGIFGEVEFDTLLEAP